jgi:tetratricopeptide (TPR) repeat protein
MLDLFIKIAVGLFLGLIGLFMTSFAAGMRETLSPSSKDHDTLGRVVFVVSLLVGFWALTIIALCVAWSVWFAIVLLPSVLIGLSLFLETVDEDVSGNDETTDQPSELGESEHAADAIDSYSTATIPPSSQLPSNTNSGENAQWCRGFDALERGKELYLRKQFQEALEQFDRAIENGLTEADVYRLRGSCLQMLDFHLDAIDDFTEALATEKDNFNLYAERSNSRGQTGDFRGEIADLQEAIRLSQIPSRWTDALNELAQEHGSPIEWYTMALITAKMSLEMQEKDERRRKEHPDVSITDLAAHNRAKCKKRMPGRHERA